VSEVGFKPTLTETNQENIDAKIDANQEKMEAKIDANNEKFEVLRDTFVSRVDIQQTRTESTQEERKPKWNYIRRRWRPQYIPSGPS
jgi:hypothetical protein